MANTDVTKTNGGSAHQAADIFAAMRSEMDRMFGCFEHGCFEHGWPTLPGMLGRSFARSPQMVPEVDVHETSKQLSIEVDLPVVDEKDVSVTLANGILTIKGQREETKDDYYIQSAASVRSSGLCACPTASTKTSLQQSSTTASCVFSRKSGPKL